MSKDEALQHFIAGYCSQGREWDERGEEEFEAWWRGERAVLTPAENAAVLRGDRRLETGRILVKVGAPQPPPGMAPGGWRIATEYDCQPTRARGVLRWIARGLWDRPPQIMREHPDGPELWRFDYDTGTYRLFKPNAAAAS